MSEIFWVKLLVLAPCLCCNPEGPATGSAGLEGGVCLTTGGLVKAGLPATSAGLN